MSPETAVSLESIRRRSRNAALLSLVGLLVVGGSLFWSAINLRRLDEQVVEKQAAIAKAEGDLAELEAAKARREQEIQAELAALERQAKEADAALALKRRELELLEKQYAIADRQWQQTLKVAREDSPRNTAPVSTLVEPKASARRLGSNDYECIIWLDVPAERRREIRAVTYRFNHPTFTQQEMRSDDANLNFAVGYRGWGALRLVIITLELRDGSKSEIAFDMAKALGLASTAGGKVPFESSADQWKQKVPIEVLKRTEDGGFTADEPNRN